MYENFIQNATFCLWPSYTTMIFYERWYIYQSLTLSMCDLTASQYSVGSLLKTIVSTIWYIEVFGSAK